MLTAQCPGCETRYRVPETAAGKRTTCKKCGQSFRIAAPQAPAAKPAAEKSKPRALADDDLLGLADLDALSKGETVETVRPPAAPAHNTAHAPAVHPTAATGTWGSATAADVPEIAGAAYARYMRAVGASFGFLAKPSNLIIFLILWVMLAIREVALTGMQMAPPMAWMFLGMAAAIITGWYMAFQLNCVIWAAGEDDELPPVVTEEGMWEGVGFAALRVLATYVFAFAPAVIMAWVLMNRIDGAVLAADQSLIGGWPNPVPATSAFVAIGLLAAAGLFIWPMAVLVVAIGGGFMALARLDLIYETIVRSFPAYLLTVIAVYVTWFIQIIVSARLWGQVGTEANLSNEWFVLFLLPALFAGVNLFFTIVTMRAIGYYYCYFKERFAWDWG